MAAHTKLGTAALLYKAAYHMGLQPVWLRPNGAFLITTSSGELYINNARSPLNSHTGSSLARDKYLTRLILQRHAMPNIPFLRPQNHAEATTFLQLYGTIVAKPVRGSGSRDIHIVTKTSQLLSLQIKLYILEQYINGTEMRYLILNGSVIAVHRSDYGGSVDEHRALKRISYTATDWNPALVSLSTKIASCLGLSFAAVDYLVNPAGRHYILEVNSTPGFKWFHAPTSGPVVDVARLFLESISEAVPA